MLSLAATLATAAVAEPPRDAGKGKLFDGGSFGKSKEPIVVVSDTLEYDYKANVVVYRGDVQATQGPVKVRSDTLTVTLVTARDGPGDRQNASAGESGPLDAPGKGTQRLQEVVAVGNVRIDNGTRWATGGHAVFDQTQRTLVLTETPMLHDGANEVAGDKVIVYLDEDRSVVEGGRKRVKAVLYPNQNDGLAPAGPGKGGAHAAAAPGKGGAAAPAGTAASPSGAAAETAAGDARAAQP